MRITTLAAFFALSLGACTGTLADDPTDEGGGDDGSGSGSNNDPGTGSNNNGLTVTLDRSTIDTEYFTTHPIKVTLQGTGGFSGNVALAASVVDGAGVTIPNWTVELASPSATLATDGSAEIMATLKIPSATTATAATVKFTATSSVATVNVQTTVNALKQITFEITQNGNSCVYNPTYGTQAARLPIILGTKVRMLNKGPLPLIVHGNGVIPHQSTAGTGIAMNAAYEPNIQTANNGDWYCHSLNGVGQPQAANRPFIVVMAP